jgi:hypothetical protein
MAKRKVRKTPSLEFGRAVEEVKLVEASAITLHSKGVKEAALSLRRYTTYEDKSVV